MLCSRNGSIDCAVLCNLCYTLLRYFSIKSLQLSLKMLHIQLFLFIKHLIQLQERYSYLPNLKKDSLLATCGKLFATVRLQGQPL